MSGSIESLFGIGGSTHEKLTIQDKDLGTFTALNSSNNKIIWNGKLHFLGDDVALIMHGERDALDVSQKQSVANISISQEKIKQELDRVLKERYNEDDKEYTNWRDMFKCISISVSQYDTNILVEDKDSMSRLNVRLKDGKAVEVEVV